MDAACQPRSDSRPEHGSESVKSWCIASVSLILPACNAQEVIEQTIGEAEQALGELTTDYEILVVDDGSSDATRACALRAAASRPRVHVISHAAQRGYGAALRTGFAAATKQFVGFADADGQFDLGELKRLALLVQNCDIACGYRVTRQDPWYRQACSRIYNRLVRLLLGTRVRDCNCGMKLLRREALPALPITTDGQLVHAELLARARMADLTVVEVGVNQRSLEQGYARTLRGKCSRSRPRLLRFWWSTGAVPGQFRLPADSGRQRGRTPLGPGTEQLWRAVPGIRGRRAVVGPSLVSVCRTGREPVRAGVAGDAADGRLGRAAFAG